MWIIKEYAKAIIALAILGVLLWLQATYEFTLLDKSVTQMEPAVSAGSINLLHEPPGSADKFSREDIVFFSFKTDKGDETFVSRIVGLPGDRISIDNGRLIRNGELAEESFLPAHPAGIYLEEVTVPRDHLFVLNDDREQATDSRSLGPVPWTAVSGKKSR